ncbi:WxL domain-containing protein [Enterococcus termitis]
MTKQKLISSLALSALVLGIATPALADEATSNATVTFVEDEGQQIQVTQVSLIQIQIQVNQIQNQVEVAVKTTLRIDYVTHMQFGEQKISGSTKAYHPLLAKWNYEEGSVYIPQFIQITDNRGTNDGWDLQVERSEFQTADEAILAGAELKITNGEVVNMGDAPTSATPSTVNKTVTIPVGSAAKVMSAKEDQGMATWSYSFGEPKDREEASKDPKEENQDVTLSVPGTAKKIANEEYKSELTWTLVASEA